MTQIKTKLEENFPNGFDSWYETFYEIVAEITTSINLGDLSKKITKIQKSQGRGGLYELSKELTDKFEILYKDKEWNGEFFDTLDKFLNKELYEANKN